MPKLLLPLLLLLSASVLAQKTKPEFEGCVTYRKTYINKDNTPIFDGHENYRLFGLTRTFYFKAGKHKWVAREGLLQYDLYNPALNPYGTYRKWRNSDSIVCFHNVSASQDTVIKIIKNAPDSILGHKCQSVTFVISTGPNANIRYYTYYYPTDKLTYKNVYYDQFKADAQATIAKYINAIPLRIIFESKDEDLKTIYEATEIFEQALPDDYFKPDPKMRVQAFRGSGSMKED